MAWRLGVFDRAPAPPPNPLASLDAASITAATLFESGKPTRAEAEQLRAVAAAIATLKSAPRLDGRPVNWAGARQVRARTVDGVVLTLQIVPTDDGAFARVTGDAATTAVDVRRQAAAIRALRHYAFRLDAQAAAVLLQP